MVFIIITKIPGWHRSIFFQKIEFSVRQNSSAHNLSDFSENQQRVNL